jgi:glutamate-1-semialdehyde 2,1-aminomutase
MSGPRSKELLARACRRIPGGVNSPVRAYRAVGGEPPFIARASGARVLDADGRDYIDYVGSWGPAILGHAHPDVLGAVTEAAAQGLTFGAPTEREVRLAERLCELVPSMERVRLVSSGTEATMSALRVARAATGRDRILKFAGCYHGHADGLLVKAGSGAATFGVPDSPGVPAALAALTATAPFNDLDAVRSILSSRDVAAVIVEPVVGNMGLLLPRPGFLEGLRGACDETGTLLVFDEVLCGFRIVLGGYQSVAGVRPDLTCLGKVVGGGLPLGAYGGRADLMRLVAPEGPVYQAGTLSGNPLATAAGLATLELLAAPGTYERLADTTRRLALGLAAEARAAGVPLTVPFVGSLFTPFFAEPPVDDEAGARRSDTRRFAAFHREMLARGIYLPPSQFETAFVSLAHGDAEVAETLEAARAALRAGDSRVA